MTIPEKIEFENGYKEENFVGIRYYKDKIKFYLPVGYDNDIFDKEDKLNSEQKENLLLLFNTISLAKTLDDEKIDFGNDSGAENEIPYNSFIWIIKDYYNNGLYQEIEKNI